jgi:hypothetical protein
MTADSIRASYMRDYRAWLAQSTVYGLPTDDATFVAWWVRIESQERDRLRALLAR